MIGVDWTKLAKKCGKIESINISKPSIVKDGNLITIYQHPGAGLLASSSSPCIIYGKQHGACMHGSHFMEKCVNHYLIAAKTNLS